MLCPSCGSKDDTVRIAGYYENGDSKDVCDRCLYEWRTNESGKGVTTCGLWGCGKPADGDRVVIELADGFRKSIELCRYHSMMVRDAA